MSWIKRNLYFVIFSAVAVALLGLSGWYFYANYQRNNDMVTKLNGQYECLQQLNNEKPHPGKGSINNIETAKEQRAQLTNYLQQVRRYFTRIPAIPDMSSKVSVRWSSCPGVLRGAITADNKGVCSNPSK